MTEIKTVSGRVAESVDSKARLIRQNAEKMSLKRALKCKLHSPLVRKFIAEIIGTAVLITFGDGSVAQYVLSSGKNGTILSVNLAWGIAVMMGILVSGGVSGGHINPAVTLAQFVLGHVTVLECVIYMLAQYIGAFLGAAVVFLTYYQAHMAYAGGQLLTVGANATAGIYSTYPQDYLNAGGGIGDQLVGTFFLALGVAAITDARNMAVSKQFIPLYVGLLVMAIGMSFGYNCGYAINPARDLGPRIFSALAGFGTEVFSLRDYNWFWIPIVCPYVGGVIGFLFYEATVALHWPSVEDDRDKDKADNGELHKLTDDA